MLERFKANPSEMIFVESKSLEKTSKEILVKEGMRPSFAASVSEALVAADMRGADTHGASNLIQPYVDWIRDKKTNPDPILRMVQDFAAIAKLDADNGLATGFGKEAMNMAIDKAKKFGVGVVTIKNAGHSGAIGTHAMHAVKEEMIGMVMTTVNPIVVPTFGAEQRLGTNPIAVAAPARNEPDFLFDVATSTIAGGKAKLVELANKKLGPFTIASPSGEPIQNEISVPDITFEDILFLPFGGSRDSGSHKGYGFAMVAEIMSGILSGCEAMMMKKNRNDPRGALNSHFFAAFNIAAFGDVEIFKSNMDQMLIKLKETKPSPGNKRVIYPGLLEREEEIFRAKNGIPLHKNTMEWFDSLSKQYDIEKIQRIFV
jgi:L-2-hydroxycarboxylate dehydrogenase (NAD+)